MTLPASKIRLISGAAVATPVSHCRAQRARSKAACRVPCARARHWQGGIAEAVTGSDGLISGGSGAVFYLI
jgi:hypothetical protein